MTTQNWNATDYHQHSSAQFKWAKELIDSMTLQGNETLLDLGCGDGKITSLLAQKLSNGIVIGGDPDNNMLHTATSLFPPTQFTNLTFEKVNASKLTDTNKFDIIFSNSALHWIKDHQPVLNGIYRALKPQGKLYFRCGGKGTLDGFQPMLNEMLTNTKWTSFFTDFELPWGFFDDTTYTQWLIQNQLTPISVKLVPSKMVHDNQKGLEGWIRTTWHPYLNRIPTPLKDDFVTELTNRYLTQNPPNSKGTTSVNMIRLEVIAEKNKV